MRVTFLVQEVRWTFQTALRRVLVPVQLLGGVTSLHNWLKEMLS
jgi:hypothetical protein